MKRLACVSALIMLFACTAAAVDVDSLLVQSVGGPLALKTLADMESYRTTGVANLNGLEGEYRQVFSSPSHFYIEIRLGEMNLVQAYDGETAWKRDHNGRASEVEGMEKRQLMTQLYLASYSFVVPGRLPGEAELLGDTTANDTAWFQVALYPLLEDTVLLLLHKQTAEPRYIIEKLDNLTGVTRVDDYRIVDDVRLAFHARTDFLEAPIFTEMATDTAAFNVPVDPALFQMPGEEHADFRFEDGADSVVIPFRYFRGHIWIPATINGVVSGWFILDSGASANMFNEPAVAPLNLVRTGALPAMGIGGIDEIPLVRTDSVSIGSLTLLNQIGGIIDFGALGIQTPPGTTAGGLLGYDFLSRFPVLIDYQDSSLTVYNSASFTPPKGGQTIDFHLTLLVPTVRASIGGVAGDFIIDLGNAVGMILHHRFYESHRLDTVLADVREVDRTLSGVGGGAKTIAAVIPNFQLGEIRIDNLPTIIPESTQGLAGSEELAGNIGNLVLERFRVLLDYSHNRLYLYPAEEYR